MIHLNCRSSYSFLRAFGTPEQIVARAKALGHSAVGIADYVSTWSHIPLWKAAKKAGIKPIFGVAIPVVTALEKDPRYDLVSLFAKSDLQQLYRLLALAVEQTYFRPRLTWKQVYEAVEEGLVAIADRVGPENYGAFENGVFAAFSHRKSFVSRYAMAHPECGVAAFAPSFPRPQDRAAMELITKIAPMSKMGELNLEHTHMLSQAEHEAVVYAMGVRTDSGLAALYADTADRLASLQLLEVPQLPLLRPNHILETVEEWCARGAKDLGIDIRPGSAYGDRLSRELAVIRQKSFEDYFLIVADLIEEAKKTMFVGPGRGSAGGSLICYLMGITSIDPLEFGTLFERFIDASRNDYPDIDSDFPDTKREQIFDYLHKRYGSDRVARLGTISFFKSKSAVLDASRTIGLSFDAQRQLSAALGDDDSLADALTRPEVAQLLKTYPQIEKALLIEDQPRHSGIHAAGVIISSEPINRVAFVGKGGVASVTLEDAPDVGLLKIDALGLRTLSVIEEACQLIGKNPQDFYRQQLNEDDVFALFRRDAVAGIFQFEGHAVRGLMRKIHVDNFMDLCVLIALARPGPLQGGGAEAWVKRRSGANQWEYEHPILKKITEETLGIIVFEEQMMMILRELGGFDDAAVNKVRKSVKKKDPQILHGFETQFIEAANKHMPQEVAEKIWAALCDFGAYAFNKSHSVAYAKLSYVSAWLKTHHPLEFAVAQLRCETKDETARSLLREVHLSGIEIIPFDPHVSEISWSTQDGKLYGGFTAVKGIGQSTAQRLLEIRKANPKDWMIGLSPAMRKRLLAPDSTPWHNLNRIERTYRALYADPEGYRSKNLPRGVSGSISRINEIPHVKGQYRFIATLKKKQLRDKNDAKDVAKRDGQVLTGDTIFLNCQWEDDTGEIWSTISTQKFAAIGKKLWEDTETEGKDYLVVASMIADDRPWMFVDKVMELTGDESE